MTCPDCERYKKSAAMWRNKAYEASGHPLPWKPDELWQGLTDEEIFAIWMKSPAETEDRFAFVKAVMEKLKEKNG